MSHHCHAIGCEIAVPPELLMCRAHWYSVPAYIRSQVWSTYRAGQCDDRNPSGSWMIAATRAIMAVAVKEGVLTHEQAVAKIAHEIELFSTKRVQTTLVNIRNAPSIKRDHNYVYIGRGSPYGNPFSHVADSKYPVIRVKTREEAIAAYRVWINSDTEMIGWTKPTHEQIMALRGRKLGCYCDPLPCHGEPLIDYIEAEPPPKKFADVSGVSPTEESPSEASSLSETLEGSGGGTDLFDAPELTGIDGPAVHGATIDRSELVCRTPAIGEKGGQAETAGSVPLTSALSPFLRYVGGKRWLVDRLVPEILACKPTLYVEPFLGAGAIALALPPELPKLLSDFSEPLINLWNQVQESPRLVCTVARMIFNNCGNTKEGYLLAREHFNSLVPPYDAMTAVERAGLMLYLNATGYNGVWRESKKSGYNVPFGRVKNVAISDDDELRAISATVACARIFHEDYKRILESLVDTAPGDGEERVVIYADPPYHGGFDAYLAGGFADEQHRELAGLLRLAVEQGIKVFATNADTEFIRSLYSWAKLEVIDESRNVAQKVKSRKAVPCLLIRGGS